MLNPNRKLKVCAQKKYPIDTRMQKRFLDFGNKMIKMSRIQCSLDWVQVVDYDMVRAVMSSVDFVNEMVIFSDNCNIRDYEMLEEDFARDLKNRMCHFRHTLHFYIDQKINGGEAKQKTKQNKEKLENSENQNPDQPPTDPQKPQAP